MKSMNYKFFLLVATATLGACAQIQPYSDAQGGNTAKLRLKMNEPIVSNLFLRAVDVDSCQLGDGFEWVSGGVDRLYTKKVGMLDSAPPREGIIEFTVPAGKPLAAVTVMHVAKLNFVEIMFALTPTQQADTRAKQPGICPAPVLDPKPGDQYEISYQAGPGTCKTTIHRLTSGPSGVNREDVTTATGREVVVTDGKPVCKKS